MEKATENLLIAAQRLSELGLDPMYARFLIQRRSEDIGSGDPAAIAKEIFDAAGDEWKTGAKKDGGERDGGGSGDYDPVAAGKEMAETQKAHRGADGLAFK